MRALTLADGQLTLNSDYCGAEAGDGDILVRPIQAGICETDLQLVQGYMGFSGVLGHEFVGIAGSGKYAGQRVVGEINCVCGKCHYCESGLGNHCPNRTVIGILNHDGAFAESLLVPEVNLHAIPDELTNDQATLVEPVAAALQIREQVRIEPGMNAVVLGDGRLGNLCAQALNSQGCEVLVVGKHREKLDRLSRLGVSTSLLDETPTEREADLVVDCTGSMTGLPTALSLVRPRGTVILKTTVSSQHAMSMAPLVIDEITLIGSRCGPFAAAIDAIKDGQFELSEFVSGRYPLEEFQQAFEHAKAPDALKVLFDISPQ